MDSRRATRPAVRPPTVVPTKTDVSLSHGQRLSVTDSFDRLTREGWISSDWRVTENGQRARYYRLTAAGRRRLAAETKAWKRLASGVALILSTR